MGQLAAADREVHLKLAELTRAGLPLGPNGELPMDKHVDDVLRLPSVMWLLMPRPKGNSDRTPSKAAPAAPAPKHQPDKRPTKNHKFDKTKGKRVKTPMPLQLRGGTPNDADGKSICFGYNLGTCREKNCKKGRHICCKPGCFSGAHTFLSHGDSA